MPATATEPRATATGLLVSDVNTLDWITAIPLNVREGSGCYVATCTLLEGLRRLGIRVTMVTPRFVTPVYLATRVLFNESLRHRRFQGDATIGVDADGYRVAGTRKAPHIACIKGVLGDAVPFESGATRASMAIQARLEAKHAQRADLVITVSRYCAARLEALYRVKNAVIVPELIDLDAWIERFHANPASPDPSKFTVLSVCRFYPRKRLDVLLSAVERLSGTIPQLEIRIVGNGPQRGRLHEIARRLRLESVVHWLGDISLSRLAREYNRADVFCLPSAQEGFGIVFLEAMAAGKPIVAARAAAVPEVVRHGILVDPGDSDALADALLHLYRHPEIRQSSGCAGRRDVEQFEMTRVARSFIVEVAKIAPEIQLA